MGKMFLAGAALLLMALGAAYALGPRSEAGARADLPAPPREIPVGQPLPPLSLADDHGDAVLLSALRGKPVVLLFFRAASCPFCRTQLTAFSAAAARFESAGLQVVATSPDTPQTLAKLRQELHLPMRLLSDANEQAVNRLCGGVAHCELIVDSAGVVRWGAFTESWSHAPEPATLVDLARALRVANP